MHDTMSPILIKPEAIVRFLLSLIFVVRKDVILVWFLRLFSIVLPLRLVLLLVALNLLIEQIIIILLLAPLRRLMIVLVPLLIRPLFQVGLLILCLHLLLNFITMGRPYFLKADGRLLCLKRVPKFPETVVEAALGCCIK